MKEVLRKKLKKSLYHRAYSRALYTLWGTVIKEIRLSFRQFYTWKYPVKSFFRTLTIIFSSFTRVFLGRSLNYSFAFTGEDRIIEGIIKPIIDKNGLYVDVGCNHPKFLSNTYGLYRKGWRGLCIDANNSLIKKYNYYRPKDIAIHSLVSNVTEERTFYLVENDVLSTTEKSNLPHLDKLGLSHESIQLFTRTLTSILDENKFAKEFDILSIDVEEHDLSVLKSLDFTQYHPQLIIIEDETFDPLNNMANSIDKLMQENNYKLKGFVLKNLYYVKSA